MKWILFHAFLIIGILLGFTGQSWAFDWLHHHHDSSNTSQGTTGTTSSTGNAVNGVDPGADPLSEDALQGGANDPITDPGDPSNPSNNNSPQDVVPEPLTILLMGMGLTVILLKRRLDGELKRRL